MYCKSLNRVLMVSFVALVAAVCLVSTAQADVIADWQFNNGGLLVDSSGNGNTLAIVGGTVGNTGGDAVFSGAGWLQTSLDLTGYRQLTVSFGVNVTTPVADYPALFEHVTPFYNNPGAVFAHLGPGTDVSTSNYCGIDPTAGTANYNVVGFTAVPAADYVMTYDLDVIDGLTATEVCKVYIDGVLSSTLQSTNALAVPNDFTTGLFNIGGRGDATLNMSGTMSYFKIEGQVPEPGTILLLTTGLVGLLCYAWRKR